jgi:hypothetical protein
LVGESLVICKRCSLCNTTIHASVVGSKPRSLDLHGVAVSSETISTELHTYILWSADIRGSVHPYREIRKELSACTVLQCMYGSATWHTSKYVYVAASTMRAQAPIQWSRLSCIYRGIAVYIMKTRLEYRIKRREGCSRSYNTNSDYEHFRESEKFKHGKLFRFLILHI